MSDMPGLSALYLQDPKLAAALRSRLYAEQLQKAGGDTSAIQSPWQGVARVVQGLLGGFEEGRADSELRQMGDGQKAEADKFRQQFMPQAVAGAAPQQPPPMAAALSGNTMDFYRKAVLPQESSNPNQPGIVGDGGRAAGPGQVHQAALTDVNMRNGTGYTQADLINNPQVGQQVGHDYFRGLLDQFGGDQAKALAAYNAGPGRVAAAVQAYGGNWMQGIPDATKAYVQRGMQAGGQGGQAPPQQQPDVVARANAELDDINNRLMPAAAAGRSSNNPNVRREAEAQMEILKFRAQTLQHAVTQATTLANRDTKTIDLRGPDGTVMRYELLPNGKQGRPIGLAPDQPGDKGIPTGYRAGADGKAVKIEGLPETPDAVANQKFTQSNGLRDEFRGLTTNFRTVQDAYENIATAAKSQSGAGDMSMLYSFVKLLDPTSVVRESEFAAAAASGSFGERIKGAADRIISGERLPDSLRESFMKEAQSIYGNQERAHNTVADQYRKLAERYGLDPETVVTPFTRSQNRPAAEMPIAGKTEKDRVAEGDWRPSDPGETNKPKMPPLPPGYTRVK